MRYQRYGIVFERLERQHLEMVRKWRNADIVRTKMHFQEIITESRQEAWFEQLDTKNNWYFVASAGQIPLGLWHIKNINWETRTGESGAFVSDGIYIGDVESGLAIIGLMDFAFLILGLEQLQAKYHPQHGKTVAMNNTLGYSIISEDEDGFIRSGVHVETYLRKTSALRSAAEKMRGSVTLVSDDNEWLAERAILLRSEGKPYLLKYLSVPPSL